MDSYTNDKQLALNRSSSFSGSPITRKICVEQSFQNHKGETLIRQYSCEQIYGSSSKNTVQFKESVIVQSPRKRFEFKSPQTIEQFPFISQSNNQFSFQKNCPEQEGFTQTLMHNKNNIKEDKIQECTPMDVDTSEDYSMSDVHSGKCETEISENHTPKISKLTFPVTKPDDVKLNKSNSQIFKQYLKVITVFIIPIICAYLVLQNSNDVVSSNFETENITNSIENLLYGQPEVVTKIKDSLTQLGDRQLFVFTGGIGVGKTYTANIISKNFPLKKNIVKTSFPQYKNINIKLNDGYNLVIVDNLEIEDNNHVISFVKKLHKSDKKLIVILIYTIAELSVDMSSGLDLITTSNKISESLSELKHSLVVFHKLSEDVVKKCIRFAMSQKGLTVNDRNIQHVLESLNYKYSGCKGVYTKVALLR